MISKPKIVPDEFGIGVIIPLINDKGGDLSNSVIYRSIILCSLFCKLFEIIVFEVVNNKIQMSWNQFGSKKGYSCMHALLVKNHYSTLLQTRCDGNYVCS